jgi:leucyl/phenylalanyl-tRNA---protein transferase
MRQQSEEPYFPSLREARPDGLLRVGGQLSPSWLLAAYRRGIFPWPVVDRGIEILAWFSPDPRAILPLDALHIPQRLQRRLRRSEFQVTFDRAFSAVVAACAEPRTPGGGTWITSSLAAGYEQLHTLGCAHSVEIWQDEQLVGGLYGVALGGFFAGESMFHRRRDASKVALVHLVQHLRERQFALFDVQQPSSHLRHLGAAVIRRADFLRRLKHALALPVTFTD